MLFMGRLLFPLAGDTGPDVMRGLTSDFPPPKTSERDTSVPGIGIDISASGLEHAQHFSS